MGEDVLDLRREVAGHCRKLRVQRPDQFQRMPGTIQEIRVAEGDVAGARRYHPPNVFEHHVPRHGEKPSTIDGWDGTVQAVVEAPATRLDVTGRRHGPVAPCQVHVALETRERAPVGNWI